MLTTNCITKNYTRLQTKICAHATHKLSNMHTKPTLDVALHKLHMKLT